jgi:hypothetical protein
MPSAETRAASAVPRRVLGQYQRGLRQQAGLTVKLAPSLMEWSEPKLWRIETGQTALRTHDVQATCTAYGAPPDLTQALTRLATQTRADGWWRAYGGTIPDDFDIYTALEDAACALAVYAPGQAPGLLRTEAYARALVSSTGVGGDEAGRLVYDCLARRALLTRARSPLMLTVALDEALVRRPVGGLAVMAGQVRFLAGLAALQTVWLRVVPDAAGPHPGLGTGAFTLLYFPPSNRGGDTGTAALRPSSIGAICRRGGDTCQWWILKAEVAH